MAPNKKKNKKKKIELGIKKSEKRNVERFLRESYRISIKIQSCEIGPRPESLVVVGFR